MSIVKDIKALRVKSTDVASVEEAASIIKQLEKELKKVGSKGVGLAGIQIGIPKRVGVINYKGKTVHLINPQVVSKEGEFVFGQEGCLSFPRQYINTKRYTDVVIDNNVIDGDKFRKERFSVYYSPEKDQWSDDLLAIAVQHELDHFDGKVFMDIEAEKALPIKRAEKVGRNDSCPCGSGKKYKKCCLGT